MGMNYQKKAIEIMDNVSKVIVGKEDVTKLVLTSLIAGGDRKSTRLNSSHTRPSRMPSSA